MILAATWGLQYSQLKRPKRFMGQKRKAELDNGSESRRVKAREEFEDEIVESVISQDENGEFSRQDRPLLIT